MLPDYKNQLLSDEYYIQHSYHDAVRAYFLGANITTYQTAYVSEYLFYVRVWDITAEQQIALSDFMTNYCNVMPWADGTNQKEIPR